MYYYYIMLYVMHSCNVLTGCGGYLGPPGSAPQILGAPDLGWHTPNPPDPPDLGPKWPEPPGSDLQSVHREFVRTYCAVYVLLLDVCSAYLMHTCTCPCGAILTCIVYIHGMVCHPGMPYKHHIAPQIWGASWDEYTP